MVRVTLRGRDSAGAYAHILNNQARWTSRLFDRKFAHCWRSPGCRSDPFGTRARQNRRVERQAVLAWLTRGLDMVIVATHDLAPRDRLSPDEPSTLVTERQAALGHDIGVLELLSLVREPNIRRALGWPRPLGVRVFFAREALNPSTSVSFLALQPEGEPWPRSKDLGTPLLLLGERESRKRLRAEQLAGSGGRSEVQCARQCIRAGERAGKRERTVKERTIARGIAPE